MKKIVIVEDNALAVFSLLMVLRSVGYEVVEPASSGEQALGIIRREKPDVVFMDVLLGGELTGIETVIRMRRWYDGPVVFMTAYRDQETLNSIAGIARTTCLFKPFSADDITSMVTQVLGE